MTFSIVGTQEHKYKCVIYTICIAEEQGEAVGIEDELEEEGLFLGDGKVGAESDGSGEEPGFVIAIAPELMDSDRGEMMETSGSYI